MAKKKSKVKLTKLGNLETDIELSKVFWWTSFLEHGDDASGGPHSFCAKTTSPLHNPPNNLERDTIGFQHILIK